MCWWNNCAQIIMPKFSPEKKIMIKYLFHVYTKCLRLTHDITWTRIPNTEYQTLEHKIIFILDYKHINWWRKLWPALILRRIRTKRIHLQIHNLKKKKKKQVNFSDCITFLCFQVYSFLCFSFQGPRQMQWHICMVFIQWQLGNVLSSLVQKYIIWPRNQWQHGMPSSCSISKLHPKVQIKEKSKYKQQNCSVVPPDVPGHSIF